MCVALEPVGRMCAENWRVIAGPVASLNVDNSVMSCRVRYIHVYQASISDTEDVQI